MAGCVSFPPLSKTDRAKDTEIFTDWREKKYKRQAEIIKGSSFYALDQIGLHNMMKYMVISAKYFFSECSQEI